MSEEKLLLENKVNGLLKKDGVSFLIPFIMITACFALWGFANDVTSPMVKAFSKIFRMSVTEGALVQVAFYLGYFVMAFPAALFIQRYSFKSGVMIGLGLYAIGALLFIPAKEILSLQNIIIKNPRQGDGYLLSVPLRLFYHDLRTVVSRDQLQPVHLLYGK